MLGAHFNVSDVWSEVVIERVDEGLKEVTTEKTKRGNPVLTLTLKEKCIAIQGQDMLGYALNFDQQELLY